MEWTGFHEIQRPRALPDLQNSFERTDDVAGYAVNVLVERREWLGTVRLGMLFFLFRAPFHPYTDG